MHYGPEALGSYNPGRIVTPDEVRWNLVISELLDLPSCAHCGSPNIYYTSCMYAGAVAQEIVRRLHCQYCGIIRDHSKITIPTPMYTVTTSTEGTGDNITYSGTSAESWTAIHF